MMTPTSKQVAAERTSGTHSEELMEFIRAVDERKRLERLPILPTSMVFEVVLDLGYAKKTVEPARLERPNGWSAEAIAIVREHYPRGSEAAQTALQAAGYAYRIKQIQWTARRLGVRCMKSDLFKRLAADGRLGGHTRGVKREKRNRHQHRHITGLLRDRVDEIKRHGRSGSQ